MKRCENWTIKKSERRRTWCFQTVVLEKTLENSWNSKEIKPVNPKGNQLWIFTGRIDAETLILWPLDAKNWLTGKDPDAGKDWRREEMGTTGWDGWTASLTQQTWVWANFGRYWRTGRPGVLQSMGSQRVGHDWATEQQQAISQVPSLAVHEVAESDTS